MKHAPTLEEFAGNPEAVEAAKRWALGWRRGQRARPLLFHGPAGCGKSALAHALAAAMGWEVVELNASDLRTREEIERRAGLASAAGTLAAAERLILIDEIDGLQSADRGGAAAALALANNARHPVIFTANDIWNPALSHLRTACTAIEFKRVNAADIAKALRRIAEREGAEVSAEAITAIARGAGGDLRAAINDLQAACEGGALSLAPLGQRDREKKVFGVLRELFKSTSFAAARAAADGLDMDHELFKKWVEENIPAEYEDAGDLARALDALSRADVFDGRIIRRQYWGLLRYANDLLTAGVALAKHRPYHKFASYAFPHIIRALSASKHERSLARRIGLKLGRVLHCSSREAAAYFPLLRAMAEKKGTALAALFGLDEEETAFLARGRG